MHCARRTRKPIAKNKEECTQIHPIFRQTKTYVDKLECIMQIFLFLPPTNPTVCPSGI